MKTDRFMRFSALVGEETLQTLSKSHILIFGIGGVGSYLVEALARCGVGKLTLVDFDTVAMHNINRQLHALTSTVGQKKVDLMKIRIKDINPDCEVQIFDQKVTAENIDSFFTERPDYVADAIDDVAAKIAIVMHCKKLNIPSISAMGTGNKLHPEMLTVADIKKTSVCPLSRVVRRKLREQGVESGVTVVFSPEIPIKSPLLDDGRPVPASSCLVPPSAGILMASRIIDDYVNKTHMMKTGGE
jgi:tRNA A37 threonylcarbamoyladenosine dehydratase